MNRYLEEAKAIRASIDGLAGGQSDEKLADNKAAFPWWNGDGVYYLTGMLLRHSLISFNPATDILSGSPAHTPKAPNVPTSESAGFPISTAISGSRERRAFTLGMKSSGEAL